LLLSGTIFGLGGGSHLVALLLAGRAGLSDLPFVVENTLLGAIGLGLAFWALRLTQARLAGR
jgi:hypothetical protein